MKFVKILKKIRETGLIPVILFFSLLFFITGLFLINGKKQTVAKNPSQNHNSFKAGRIPKATLTSNQTVTPTLTPTPTPVPLVGFCQKVPVLLYHHIESLSEAKKEGHGILTVDSSIFEKQMEYLVLQGYNFLTAEQLAQALINKQSLGKSVVLTFDDGYEDIYTYAYPLFQKYHIIANLMIPTGLLGNSGYLTWDQLKNMAASGLVFAYDHTWSHASLGNASKEKMQYEIMTAKNQLEQQLGKVVNIFTYPYGSENSREIKFLQDNGFLAAFSTIPGFWQCDSFIMSLHRNRIGNTPLPNYGL